MFLVFISCAMNVFFFQKCNFFHRTLFWCSRQTYNVRHFICANPYTRIRTEIVKNRVRISTARRFSCRSNAYSRVVISCFHGSQKKATIRKKKKKKRIENLPFYFFRGPQSTVGELIRAQKRRCRNSGHAPVVAGWKYAYFPCILSSEVVRAGDTDRDFPAQQVRGADA